MAGDAVVKTLGTVVKALVTVGEHLAHKLCRRLWVDDLSSGDLLPPFPKMCTPHS